MAKRRPPEPDPRATAPPAPPPPAAPDSPSLCGLGEMVVLRVLGILAGRARTFYAAFFVAAIGAVLVAGWAMGPGRLETSAYADTLGRLTLRRPPAEGALDPDAALAALTGQVTAQVLARPDAELAALLTRLDAEHRAGRRAATVVFVPAARAAYLDARRGEAARRAALAVLDAALTQPRDDPDPEAPAFEGKLAIWGSLLDFPVDHIRNRAGWVFERVKRPLPDARP